MVTIIKTIFCDCSYVLNMAIVQKLVPSKIKLTVKDYFVLHQSRKKMTKRLTAKTIRYAMG